MIAIQNFQQRLYARYDKGLSLPPTYQYLYGHPVRPVIPLETAPRPVCLIGASPAARLAAVGPERDVPVADEGRPFSTEPYFDGRRIRANPAGTALTELYLAPLGLRREQCWPTYLVRLFLFTDEHLARYRRLGCPWPEWETHSRFETLARPGLAWLEEELALVQPRLVITLGAEVAAALQDVRGLEAGEALLSGDLQDLWLGETVYPALHLAGPTRLISSLTAPNPWPRLHHERHLPAARNVVERLIKLR